MDRQLVSLSKFLSLVLRHHPETIGLQLDPNGWVEIDALLAAAAQHGKPLDHDRLMRVVRENDKQRFSISENGKRIRASQGHSVEVDLELSAVVPPPQLYHGTVSRFLESIQKEGLIAGSRQYVHLSADEQTAQRVGQRRGKPVVLVVRSEEMAADGIEFFLSENGVWLTRHVPAQYLVFPDSP